MMNIIKNLLLNFCIVILIFLKTTLASSETIKEIEIIGNDRVSNETIMMFSEISKNQIIKDTDLNSILLNLYETNFFKDVKINEKVDFEKLYKFRKIQ